MSPMEDFVSVIFTTYNQPQWLQKVLWGFECQTHKNFEIVIADDGSQEATRELVQNFRENSHLRIQHIWHPDEGYQKCPRSEEHTSELQSRPHLVCRLLL